MGHVWKHWIIRTRFSAVSFNKRFTMLLKNVQIKNLAICVWATASRNTTPAKKRLSTERSPAICQPVENSAVVGALFEGVAVAGIASESELRLELTHSLMRHTKRHL